ncbi:hypothetical protein CVT24_003935 [Panaeolus cyanescens]|uniref:RNA helicase n=1 Tax=Panaeolus cyanescens TaxID=181874 RepID=A0A409Y6D7_9AGAR|nr:hypothetical protein CVT24_003935 [Panaeolus cyanescens]
MSSLKRNKRVASSDVSEAEMSSDADISSVLCGKRRKVSNVQDTEEDEDDELRQLLQASITSRDVKEGTRVIKSVKGKGKMVKGEIGGGSFQSMGLHPGLLRSLTLQGYRIPTPIQRSAIPLLLSNPPQDLVGMARTGSGKSLAYLIPLVQRLGGRHSPIFGSRALILLPTRELALQVLKVGKELARGFHSGNQGHAGDKDVEDSGKGEKLRWGLVVGGEGLDEQFEMITNNPDVIVATPGRLLHLVVEMNLDLKAIEMVVFDEADRLFEMGFEVALHEILQRLPASRQTMLFSATLPKSLVEFARAGLQEPKLVRLDADSKISSDLRMAFFSVKQAEKDACLLYLLRDVIKVPFASSSTNEQTPDNVDNAKTAKHKSKQKNEAVHPHQTIIFAATKHHVEYLTTMLKVVGYNISSIYGSMDQIARTTQMDQFRRGITSILVVTDVAARGIDIPVLENVINYDFPQGARVFVHRVGRTARAGRQGWAWSLVTNTELPFLLDLQLFLGKPLTSEVSSTSDQVFAENMVLGTFRRDSIDEDVEYIRSLENIDNSLPTLREVMRRGHAMYERSKGKASPLSYKRAKEMTQDPKWILAGSNTGVHPVLLRGSDSLSLMTQEDARKKLLRAVNSFVPSETIFEAGSKTNPETASLMKERRKALLKSAQRTQSSRTEKDDDSGPSDAEDHSEHDVTINNVEHTSGFKDSEFYLSYHQKDAATEKGYSLNDGASSFVKEANRVAFSLTNDEGTADRGKMTWDKKKKKFIKGDGIGADNVKIVRTENGTKLPATFRSGRFDEWKSKNKASLPRIGEIESQTSRRTQHGARRFKHNKETAPKPLDKLHKNYEQKARQRAQSSKEDSDVAGSRPGPRRTGRMSTGKSVQRIKTEIKTSAQIRKDRKIQENRRAKNARPTHRRKGKH